jgi:protein-tyrosine phosphatase
LLLYKYVWFVQQTTNAEVLMNKTAIPVFCAALALCACYTEIKPEEPSARGGLLPIAGAYNVRDIGGYRAADGKTVKWGKLVRSGDLNMLTSRDQDYLFNKMGIKTVVDFRSTDRVVDSSLNVSTERDLAPDRLPSGVTVWDKSGGASTAIPESTVVPAYEDILRDQSLDVSKVITKVEEGYRNLITDPKAKAAYLSFFDALVTSGGEPLLFHCSAGKDRAGVAAALLLKALGASDADIIANYMLSRDFVAEKYYPVVPFVVKNTKDEMNASKPLVQSLAVPPTYKDLVIDGLKADPPPRVIQGIIRGAMQYELSTNPNATVESAKAVAEAAVPYKKDNAVDDLVLQMEKLIPALTYWDIAVEKAATEAGEKIKPLLTVDERYIQAALRQLDTVEGGIEAYLGPDGHAIVATLRAQYLE